MVWARVSCHEFCGHIHLYMGHKVSADKECMMKGFSPIFDTFPFSFPGTLESQPWLCLLWVSGKTHQSVYLSNIHSFMYCLYLVTFPLYNSWSLSGEVEQTESLLFGVKSWWWCQNLGQEGDYLTCCIMIIKSSLVSVINESIFVCLLIFLLTVLCFRNQTLLWSM